MTALDQAFIKAYMHQNAAPATLNSAKPVRLEEALVDPPKGEAPQRPANLRAEAIAEAVASALERAPARTAGIAPSGPTTLEPREASVWLDEAEIRLVKSRATGRGEASSQHVKPPAPQGLQMLHTPTLDEWEPNEMIPSVRAPSSQAGLVDAGPLPAALPSAPPVCAEVSNTHGSSRFRPALVVDRFLWTSGCSRLDTVAGDQLDRLAEAIAYRGIPSQCTVAVCGCRRGDGCTTLLLCVARRLAMQGRRIILLDADFDQPMLARRLGLLPEVGWEDVLWRNSPLAEVAVESIEDRLAVVPLRGADSLDPGLIGAPVDPASDIDFLRRHYDLVLIDVGRFDFSSHRASAVFQSARQWIDAVVVVHNVRATPRTELDHTRRRLREMGIAEAGIAENFV